MEISLETRKSSSYPCVVELIKLILALNPKNLRMKREIYKFYVNILIQDIITNIMNLYDIVVPEESQAPENSNLDEVFGLHDILH